MYSVTAFVFQVIIFIPINLFLMIFMRWKITGKQIVRKELGKHQSLIFGIVPHTTYFDVLPVPASMFSLLPMRYLASTCFFEKPVKNLLFYLMGAIPAEGPDGSIFEHYLDHGSKILEKENLTIFAQGNFQKTKELIKIHDGIIRVAQLSKKPIIPTVFLGTLNETGEKACQLHLDHKFYMGLRNLRILYCDPIYVHSFGDPAADLKEREEKFEQFKSCIEKTIYDNK